MVRDAQLPAVRVKQASLKSINELRGAWSVSEYVRQAVADWVRRGKQGPDKVSDL